MIDSVVQLLRRVAQVFGVSSGRPWIGKYEVVRRLAEGGMGEIFLARAAGHSGFEKLVVLKRILQQNMADQEAVRMFMDEARLMATMNHPNIIHVYDFATAGGAHFFTMEYVHGEDLGRISREATLSGKPVSMDFAVGVIAEAAAGLHYAHEKRGKDGQLLQLVHRDISPSNVLVSYDGAVKLADFGIAKWRQRETETRYGALKGKIAYMSPEQCRGEPLDRRSDIFGLGILLYEITTGTRLYQGTSDYGILEQIVNHDPPPPSMRRAEYPAAIERIAMRALSRDRDKRYATAREMQLELEELSRIERMRTSAVARASEMAALFDKKIGAWRQAARAGQSLSEHLARTAQDVPFLPTMQTGLAPGNGQQTATEPGAHHLEAGLGGFSAEGTTIGPGRFSAAPSSAARRRRVVVSLALIGVAASVTASLVMRRGSRTAGKADRIVAPRTGPEPAKTDAVAGAAIEVMPGVRGLDPAPAVERDLKDRPSKKKRSPTKKGPPGQPGSPPKVWDPDSIYLP